jgi:hypothetical protein
MMTLYGVGLQTKMLIDDVIYWHTYFADFSSLLARLELSFTLPTYSAKVSNDSVITAIILATYLHASPLCYSRNGSLNVDVDVSSAFSADRRPASREHF